MSFEAATVCAANGTGRNGNRLPAGGGIHVSVDYTLPLRADAAISRISRLEWTWVGAILLAAGLAHGINMFHFPYYESDEGTYVSQAWSIVHDGRLSPYTYFYDHSPAGWMQLAAWAKLTGGFHTFGPAINSGRLLMLLMRVGIVLMLYRLVAALHVGPVARSMACLLFAFSPYGIYFGRRVILDNIASFWAVLSLYLLLVGTLTLRRAALAGLAIGVAALSKEPMLAVFPAFALIARSRCRGDRRVIVPAAFLILAVSACSLYVLMAALNGELFPAGTWLGGDRPHVSLIGSLQWQASRGRDGGMLQAGSQFWRMAGRWVRAAGLLVIAGTIAAGGLAVRLRRAPVQRAIGLAVLSLWAFLGRGGIVIDFYLVPLLPLLALCVAIGIARLSAWLKTVRWPFPRSMPVVRLAPFGMALACLLVQGRDFTHGALERGLRPAALWRARQADSLVRAADWLLQNGAPNSRVVLDQSMWNDLYDPVNQSRPGFTCLHYYWKVMYDPAIREAVQDDWRTVDYVVVTPQLLSDAHEDPKGRPLLEIIAHSTPVASFDMANWPVEVRRIDAPAADAAAVPGMATRAAERGRVRVARGTVVTDRGTLIRGATFELSAPDEPVSVQALSESHWREIRGLGLNTVRFDVKLSAARPRPVALDRQLARLDRAVDLAGRNGMYVVLVSSVAAGTYDKDELLRFWSAVAPRYRGRAHVLYEMVNEPVAWYPRNYTREHFRDLMEVYRLIRRAAPETHVALWTFPNLDPGPVTARVLDLVPDVSYTRELVGFHWYDAKAADAAFLQRQFPLFMTETSPGPPKTDDLAALQDCERLGVSWVHLDGKGRDVSRLRALINRLHETGFTWTADPAADEIGQAAPK